MQIFDYRKTIIYRIYYAIYFFRFLFPIHCVRFSNTETTSNFQPVEFTKTHVHSFCAYSGLSESRLINSAFILSIEYDSNNERCTFCETWYLNLVHEIPLFMIKMCMWSLVPGQRPHVCGWSKLIDFCSLTSTTVSIRRRKIRTFVKVGPATRHM